MHHSEWRGSERESEDIAREAAGKRFHPVILSEAKDPCICRFK